MNFEQIIPALRAGKSVRRKGWTGGEILKISNDRLVMFTSNPDRPGEFFELGRVHLALHDWEIVPNSGPKERLYAYASYNPLKKVWITTNCFYRDDAHYRAHHTSSRPFVKVESIFIDVDAEPPPPDGTEEW